MGSTCNRNLNLLIRNLPARPCVDYKVAEVLARGIVEDVKRGDVHLVSPVPLPVSSKPLGREQGGLGFEPGKEQT